MDKKILILIICLVLSLGYIGISEYSVWKQNQDTQIYQQGMVDAYTQIAKETSECQSIPLTYRNKNITIVSAECYQKALQQSQQGLNN